jgi:hypothetical protein
VSARVWGLVLLALAGCRPAPVRSAVEPVVVVEPEAPRRPAARRVEVDWQGALLVADVTGPTMFRHSRPESRGFAWLAPGTPLVPRGAVERGRVRGYIDGPLTVRGWIPVNHLEAIVLSRGRVRGTPLYVVPGDHVRLVEVEGGTAIIEASAHFGHPELAHSPPFRGSFSIAHLGADLVGSGAGASRGSSLLLRRAGALYAQPNGEVVWEFPALESPLSATVLREDGDWLGVRIGVGPYLVGYVSRSAVGATAHKKEAYGSEVIDPWADRGDDGPSVEDPWGDPETSGLPPMLARAAVRPVWRVRAGTRVRIEGVSMAIFREPGYAVELGRNGADVMVLAGIDGDITVQGAVRERDLEPMPAPR